MGSDIADNWQSPAPRPPPFQLSHPISKLTSSVFVCNAKQGFALCFSGIWAHDQTHVPHTGRQECLFPSAYKKKKKHGDALIEVRVNSLTWYSNSFNIYRTFSPHEMAAVVFLFFFNFERNWYQLCVCVYDDGCVHCCSWSTLIYMHVNGLEYECHCSTSTAIFVAYFFFPISKCGIKSL